MPLVSVGCRLDPFATIELRDPHAELAAAGTGELVVDVPAGHYSVWASAAGRDATTDLDVDGDDVVLELDLGPHPSAAPTIGTSTDVPGHAEAVRTMSADLAGRSHGGSSIGIVVRQIGEGRSVAPKVRLARDDREVDLSWTSPSGPRSWIATAGALVPAGRYVLTVDGDPPTSLGAPVWPGWQTLVFLPLGGTGVAASMAVVHAVPGGEPWDPAAPDALLHDRLHWALLDRPVVTDGCVRALFRQFGLQRTTSPMVHLLTAALASTSDHETARQQLRWSSDALADPAVARVIPADVVAFSASSGTEATAVERVSAPPLLARSADLLLAREQRALGSICGSAVEAMAARVASPLWFRWSTSVSPNGMDVPYDDHAFRAALTDAASWASKRPMLEGAATSSPAAARLVAYLHDEAQRRHSAPADVLATTGPAALVRGTGLPAIGVVEALRAIDGGGRPVQEQVHRTSAPAAPRPRRWRLIVGLVVAAAVLGAALWAWRRAGQDDPTSEQRPPTTDSPDTGSTVVTTRPSLADDVPVAQGRDFTLLQGGSLTAVLSGADREGTRLSYRVLDEPDLGEFRFDADGSFTYTPRADAGGRDTFTFVVNDGTQDSPPATVVIDVVPDVRVTAVDVDEEQGTLEVTVVLNGSTRVPVDVEVQTAVTRPGDATSGKDFDAVDEVLSFDATTPSTVLEIAIIDDDEEEDVEQVQLQFTVRHSGTAQPVVLTVATIGASDDDTVEGDGPSEQSPPVLAEGPDDVIEGVEGTVFDDPPESTAPDETGPP